MMLIWSGRCEYGFLEEDCSVHAVEIRAGGSTVE